ncbi:MAG: glycerate kinase [Planctomycetota bacterium]
MKIMLAPDSFKDSLSAHAAVRAMAVGIARIDPTIRIDHCPISDGGEGFVAAMASASGCELQRTTVAGPLGEPTDAVWATLSGEVAAIETAAASGLEQLAPEQRNPMHTTTLGTGELIAEALRRGCRRVLVGLGGSATTDGGTGMAQALGVRFYDPGGELIARPMCGRLLNHITRIDIDNVLPDLAATHIDAACDVRNPLTGLDGAAVIYGPQKGATPEQVAQLDDGLRHFARLLRDQLDIDIEHLPGAGAAGGLAAGLLAFGHAVLVPGIGIVLDAVEFDSRVADCDLCLTGEGRLDGQSLSGKAVMQVAEGAGLHGVPTVALVGSASDDARICLDQGLAAYHGIADGHPREYAMRHAAELLADKAEAVVQEWRDQRGA